MSGSFRKYAFLITQKFFRSIAFLPSIISIFFVAAAVLITYFDTGAASKKLISTLDLFELSRIKDPTDILIALLTGIISLTIFSFSMVMIVLNQAATTYTPKVLSLIVSMRSTQFVLGFYLGTILYYIIIIIFIQADNNTSSGGFAFYIAIALAITSILLFVNFIHTVSVSVQVKKIIQRIFAMTKDKMQKIERKNQPADINKTENNEQWFKYGSTENGYLQSYLPELPEYLADKNLKIKLEAKFGEYLLKGNDLFSVTREIDDEVREKIQLYLHFNPDEEIAEHSSYGFYQITEIAVKALSPGINDPGTALICIDYLTDLFRVKAENLKSNIVCDNKNKVRIIAKEVNPREVFYNSFTPVRTYGKGNISVIERLMTSFQKLAVYDLKSGLYKEEILNQVESIVISADMSFKTPADRDHINNLISSLNRYPDNYFSLKYLR